MSSAPKPNTAKATEPKPNAPQSNSLTKVCQNLASLAKNIDSKPNADANSDTNANADANADADADANADFCPCPFHLHKVENRHNITSPHHGKPSCLQFLTKYDGFGEKIKEIMELKQRTAITIPSDMFQELIQLAKELDGSRLTLAECTFCIYTIETCPYMKFDAKTRIDILFQIHHGSTKHWSEFAEERDSNHKCQYNPATRIFPCLECDGSDVEHALSLCRETSTVIPNYDTYIERLMVAMATIVAINIGKLKVESEIHRVVEENAVHNIQILESNISQLNDKCSQLDDKYSLLDDKYSRLRKLYTKALADIKNTTPLSDQIAHANTKILTLEEEKEDMQKDITKLTTYISKITLDHNTNLQVLINKLTQATQHTATLSQQLTQQESKHMSDINAIEQKFNESQRIWQKSLATERMIGEQIRETKSKMNKVEFDKAVAQQVAQHVAQQVKNATQRLQEEAKVEFDKAVAQQVAQQVKTATQKLQEDAKAELNQRLTAMSQQYRKMYEPIIAKHICTEKIALERAFAAEQRAFAAEQRALVAEQRALAIQQILHDEQPWINGEHAEGPPGGPHHAF